MKSEQISSESYQDINNLKTVESNETVLDLSGDLSTGIMFGLGHHIEDLATCEPSQQNSLVDSNEKTEKEWSVIEDSTSLSDAEPQDEEAVREINGNDQNKKHPMDRSGGSPEPCTKPFPQQSNTASYDGAMIVNATELETVTEHKSVVNKGRSSETILRFKPQEIKRVKPKVKYRNHRQYETDQILTNKSENNAVWMLEIFKRYFRQHLFKSSKPPLDYVNSRDHLINSYVDSGRDCISLNHQINQSIIPNIPAMTSVLQDADHHCPKCLQPPVC